MTEEPTLDLLFERDPAELSDQDMDRIVAQYRERRMEWKKEDSTSKSQGKRARTSKGTAVSEQLGIDLDVSDLIEKLVDDKK